MSTGKGNYINNSWVQGNGPSFTSIDPSSGQTVWEGASASPIDVNQAVEAAQKAAHRWASTPIDIRIELINNFQNALESDKQTLANTISLETGKPHWDSMNEVVAMINKIPISIEANKNRCQELSKELPNGQLITRHRPHGVVAVLGPYNFPGHLPNGHIIPALLAGNTIVYKPSEFTPLVAEKMMFYWEKCDLPMGVINVVQGGKETGQTLAKHTGINGLYFTGSWPTGKQLLEIFNDHPEKILALEMGGNNPLVIGNVIDPKAAAYMTIQSAYVTSGQRCTCARRLIVPIGEKGNEFLQTLIQMISRIKIGRFSDSPEPFMGPLINENAVLKLLHVQDTLLKLGAKEVLPMKQIKPGTGFITPGLIDVTPIKQLPDDEYFGPILQVIRTQSFEDAITEANRTGYGLAAGLLSDDEEQYKLFIEHIKAGVVNWNVPTTGASSNAPFGGIGKSGNFRPGAYYATDYCCYPVASIENQKLTLPLNVTPGVALE